MSSLSPTSKRDRNEEVPTSCFQVAGSLAFFARERITPFIREQGGWVSLLLDSWLDELLQETLCQVFPFDPEDPESRVWRGLLLVGLTLAVLTLFLAARR